MCGHHGAQLRSCLAAPVSFPPSAVGFPGPAAATVLAGAFAASVTILAMLLAGAAVAGLGSALLLTAAALVLAWARPGSSPSCTAPARPQAGCADITRVPGEPAAWPAPRSGSHGRGPGTAAGPPSCSSAA